MLTFVIKYIYITNQQMRGIHINNYIDNRVMVSGKKVKNQVQAVIHPQKPKPTIINHLNQRHPSSAEKDYIEFSEEPKAIRNQPQGSAHRKKRRTKTIILNQDLKSVNAKNRMRIPIQQLKKRQISNNKKKSSSSSPSKDSDTLNLAQTQRKLEPIYENTQGLGKRSKSAIIKRPKQLKSEQKERIELASSKSQGKKQYQKKKQKASSKQIHKNIEKIFEKPIKQKGYKKPKTKKQSVSEIKKVTSELNLSLKNKKRKNANISTLTTARKTSRLEPHKPITGSLSKHQSARGYKKIKGSEIKEEINRKLFKDQDQHDRQKQHYFEDFKKFYKRQGKSSSNKIQKMMGKLEKELSSSDHRHQLHKELKKLLEKIENMEINKEESQEEDSEEYTETRKEYQIGIFSKQMEHEPAEFNHEISSHENQLEQQSVSHNQEPSQTQQEHIYTDPINEVQLPPETESCQQEHEYHAQQKSEADNKEIENKPSQLMQTDLVKSPEFNIKTPKINENDIQELYERIEDDDDNNYPNRKMINEEKYLQENPMLNRRNNQCIDLNQYQSVKSHQNQKEFEIAQLKRFKEESNKMMEKVQKYSNKQEKKQNLTLYLETEQLQGQGEQQQSGQSTPKNIQPYIFQRYPVRPTLDDLKSPKINEQNINEILKLKQKVEINHHDKLNELVNTMFQKNILSPKTHQLQITLLNAQHEKEIESLKNYQKHADELSKILQEIRHEKAQINGIEELIRSEKWEDALSLVKTKQQAQIVSQNEYQSSQSNRSLPRQQKYPRFLDNQSEEDNSEPIYYLGEVSESNSLQNQYLSEKQNIDGYKEQEENSEGFRLIKIQKVKENVDQLSKQGHEELSNSDSFVGVTIRQGQIIQSQDNEQPHPDQIIKIDQNYLSGNKKQKGFESNLFFIKQYCIALCQFVRDFYNKQFKTSIRSPTQYDLQQLLKNYRTKKDKTSAIKINSLFEDLAYHQSLKKAKSQPISQDIFEEFNKTYEGNRYFGKQDTQDATLEGIFLKSIFNALNQSISLERPGSIHGKPLPWSHSSKHLKNMKNGSEQQAKKGESEDLIFGIAIARIIQWGSCLCGFIPDTVELENTQIDQEYVNHIRETRMALLLQKMLADEQSSMSQMQLQETEVKLYLSVLISEELINDAERELYSLEAKRINMDINQ